MNIFIWLILAKILSVLGAISNTLGFASFFFLKSLSPYSWWLVGGGFALILIGETSHYLLTRKIRKDAEIPIRKRSS